jgi:23S rRNA-/tRNA-specific pseudouridylate synthase
LSGELSVRGKGELGKLPLFDFLKKDFPGIHPINRLDFETSGVMLFAKTKECFDRAVIQGLFVGDNADVKKRYIAIVHGVPKKRAGSITMALKARTGGTVPATTDYVVREALGEWSLIEATIRAGKFHQIRRHFACIGHPLVNDTMEGNRTLDYRFQRRTKFRHLFLHAWRIECAHMITGRHLVINAKAPKQFEEAVQRLRSRK